MDEYLGYLIFSLLFSAIHIFSYFLAGMINYKMTKDFYGGKKALLTTFLRDTSKEEEISRINRLNIPAQIIRGLLMSFVLYPILGVLGELSFEIRLAFFAGLMFVYTDFASAVPFSNTIEGLVYMKKPFVRRELFMKISFEAVFYSVLFGSLASWLLF